MRDRLLKDTIGVENDSIRPRASPCVGLVGPKDGELLIRAGIWEAEAFVIVEGMWIVVTANLLAVTIVAATLGHCIIDVGLPVADAATGIDAGLTLYMPTPCLIRSGGTF